jgi:3-hydroxyacyl-[acyl-carrier-protein] dehydratase
MSPFSLDEKELLLYQPNRPPFLMIDYVTEVLPGKYANGFKNLDELKTELKKQISENKNQQIGKPNSGTVEIDDNL